MEYPLFCRRDCLIKSFQLCISMFVCATLREPSLCPGRLVKPSVCSKVKGSGRTLTDGDQLPLATPSTASSCGGSINPCTPSSPPSYTGNNSGKQGVSTAHAKHRFLDDLDAIGPMEAILGFDMYHAFDSPPKYLIFHILDRMGTPLKLLRLISLVLELGATFIRGAEHEILRTTDGVKKGCPMSCFLLVIIFNIPLRLLEHHGLCLSAFVDDISSFVPPMCRQRNSSLVQEALSLIGCKFYVIRSEVLPMVTHPPPVRSLPEYLHSDQAVQASTSIWSTSEADAPHLADNCERTFCGVSYLKHLGHPLSTSLRLSPAVRIVAEELKAQLSELHTHPIQALDRALVANTLGLPRLLYRTACLSVSATELQQLTSLLECFVL